MPHEGHVTDAVYNHTKMKHRRFIYLYNLRFRFRFTNSIIVCTTFDRDEQQQQQQHFLHDVVGVGVFRQAAATRDAQLRRVRHAF